MSKYKTLEAWIGELLAGSDRKLTALSCHHKPATGGHSEVLTLQLEGKTWTVENLFHTFRGKAEHKVQDVPGRHFFEMRAFFDKGVAHAEEHTFIVEDGELRAQGAQRRQTEDATTSGVLAQQMRHIENVLAQNGDLVKAVMSHSVQREKVLWERLDHETEEKNEAYSIVREQIFKQTQAEHQMRMSELQLQRQIEREKQMITMAPHLLNVVSDDPVLPGVLTDTDILDKAAEHLDADKLNLAVGAGLIPKEMAGMLGLRFKQALERKAKEKTALAKVPAGATDNVTPIVRKKAGEGGTPAPA